LIVADVEYNQLFRFEEMRCRQPRRFASADGHAIRTNALRFTIRLRRLRVLKHLNALSVDIDDAGSDGKEGLRNLVVGKCDSGSLSPKILNET